MIWYVLGGIALACLTLLGGGVFVVRRNLDRTVPVPVCRRRGDGKYDVWPSDDPTNKQVLSQADVKALKRRVKETIPQQKKLDELFSRTVGIRIFDLNPYSAEGSSHPLLLEITNPEEISSLRNAMRIFPGRLGCHEPCYCQGPTPFRLQFILNTGESQALNLVHGFNLGWTAWKFRAGIRTPGRLNKWWAAHGLPSIVSG